MFTPQEVSEKVFPKASFGGGGYNMASVDEFLDALTEDYTALFKENVTLKAKLKVLAEKVEEYRSTEEAMRQALLTAQKMAAKLVQEAQTEKEKILADAQVEAQAEIHRLDDERRAAEKKLQAAQEKTAAFIRRSEELCQAQSAFLQSLPELDFVPEQPESPAAEPQADVVSAIEQDILAINCESIEELELVDALAGEAGRVADVALRINPDIDPKTNHCIDTGQADSKFGISYEEVLEHAKEIRALKHINIIGLHLHIGSQIRELHVFENMCNKVNVIVENLEKLGCSFRFVDVGGGLGVNYDVPENEPIPNFASLFSIVHNHLSVGDREVHFEFGRSIVAECGELITTVLFNKTTATGRKLVIVDASMTELVRPAMYGSYHNIENITAREEEAPSEKYTVVGTACESTDVFDENVSLRKTRRGDLLTIKSAGAYGMSMASRYNLHDLPGAVYSDEL